MRNSFIRAFWKDPRLVSLGYGKTITGHGINSNGLKIYLFRSFKKQEARGKILDDVNNYHDIRDRKDILLVFKDDDAVRRLISDLGRLLVTP